MKIIVIIPTHNEKVSIGSLIDAVEQEFDNIPNHQLGILVVDDNSPDGTAAVVKEKMKHHDNIDLIMQHRKLGLGIAYLAGMIYAIKKLKADAFIEFDGDWQHNPKDIKRLVAEFDQGYDYVIGSRYVPGGSIPIEWALYRKLLSKCGNLWIRYGLRLPIRDCTSGLRLSRVEGFAEKLPLDEKNILSRRHAYKVHLLHEMIRFGATYKEIPIKFLSRKGGSSKSTMEDIIESLKVSFALLCRKSKKEKNILKYTTT